MSAFGKVRNRCAKSNRSQILQTIHRLQCYLSSLCRPFHRLGSAFSGTRIDREGAR